MATTYFDTRKNRWRVRWFNTENRRAQREFRTREEADAFVPAIPDERPHNTPGPAAEPLTPEAARLLIHRRTITNDAGCWIWTGKGGSNGYAQMTRRIDGKVAVFSMHRLSYEVFVGPIPEGLHIDHLCAVTKCVNPEHLEPVTSAENNRRRSARQAVAR